jgi:hypothetical protein
MRIIFHLRAFVGRLTRALRRRGALTGGQAVPRVKSYSAETGYVYQYFYEGKRKSGGGWGEDGTEFVFRFSADRKTWMPVSVVVAAKAIAAWREAHGRELSVNEQYAVAKMALFQAFDERAKPAELRGSVRVRNADLEGIVEKLGL